MFFMVKFSDYKKEKNSLCFVLRSYFPSLFFLVFLSFSCPSFSVALFLLRLLICCFEALAMAAASMIYPSTCSSAASHRSFFSTPVFGGERFKISVSIKR
jgi:hypothetical protein